MQGVCEERFVELEYHQEVDIRLERVEGSNSCAMTLIFGSSFLLPFFVIFSFYFLPFHPFLFVFLLPIIFHFFFTFVLSLAFHLYPTQTCLELTGLIVVVD
jgi:hypothetical protein